jgi:hypothetical protein
MVYFNYQTLGSTQITDFLFCNGAAAGGKITAGEFHRWDGTSVSYVGHTHADATTTSKGFVQVGTGLSVSSGTISVSYGTAAGTACAGNDSRLSDARTPTTHGDTYHSNMKYARITFTGGSPYTAYTWNHGFNSSGVIFSISTNSPEAHVYYTIIDANNVKISLDDPPYETIVVDVTATWINTSHLTTATANLIA